MPELAREIERARVEAGLSTEELLANLRQTQPGHPGVTVLRPGEFLLRVRDRLTRLTGEGEP